MTVGELIEKLKQCDQDCLVLAKVEDNSMQFDYLKPYDVSWAEQSSTMRDVAVIKLSYDAIPSTMVHDGWRPT